MRFVSIHDLTQLRLDLRKGGPRLPRPLPEVFFKPGQGQTVAAIVDVLLGVLVAGKVGFQNVTADQAKTAVIAYEPIWAIGTGKTATTEQAQEVCKGIRECIAEVYDEATAEAIRIQYGGSVNAATAPELFAQPDIDGGLVGGASLKADFGQIVNYK